MHTSQPVTPDSSSCDPLTAIRDRDEHIEATPLHSEAILKGRNSVTIDHEGTRYTLRTTRAGKLILTK
ncbi:MAG TPA: hemin uptake protein HemP [Azoarcus taiwanensis]|nr:hemin uptake protein HemP [Azoarcus taiwanensis]